MKWWLIGRGGRKRGILKCIIRKRFRKKERKGKERKVVYRSISHSVSCSIAPPKNYRLPPSAGPRVPYKNPPAILLPAPLILTPPPTPGDIDRDPRLMCPFVLAARFLGELPVLDCLTSALPISRLVPWWE